MEISNVKLTDNEKVQIANTDHLWRIMVGVLKREGTMYSEKEHFWVVALSKNEYIKCIDLVSLGNYNKAMVDPIKVFRSGIRKNAHHAIIMHNHPSGNPEPSKSDIDITDRLFQCGMLIGFPIIDHIIITLDGYLSFSKIKLMSKIESSIEYVPSFELEERFIKQAERVRKEAFEEGKILGEEKGIEETRILIASNMRKIGVDIKTIEKTTGLSAKLIEKL